MDSLCLYPLCDFVEKQKFSSSSFRSTHDLALLALRRVIVEPLSHVTLPCASRHCHAPERHHCTRCFLHTIPLELRARGSHHRYVPHREECPTVTLQSCRLCQEHLCITLWLSDHSGFHLRFSSSLSPAHLIGRPAAAVDTHLW
jgi:hypothetical protein